MYYWGTSIEKIFLDLEAAIALGYSNEAYYLTIKLVRAVIRIGNKY